MVTKEVRSVDRCINVALLSGSFSNLVTLFPFCSSVRFKMEAMRFKPCPFADQVKVLER